ncbi:tRNA-dihydrouridine(20a/20b) synthase [NAD(P)+]-like [Holothuria leucospilota]|uniref:tRNA-dihydrouridine(20a/20b) synthase [NAD(P)+]-like n=1 Tax=Holothuria leucospilota TaxID=206669 RepID=A0A9Q1HIP4_HOLLE|nr:tRNA-dihydrouridine(20a/20b) synthase [NAD(P)+]-like [Holothuria leucospilota]
MQTAEQNRNAMEKKSVSELLEEKGFLRVCAPMVRYSKLAFRTLVRRYNSDLAFTPMIISESFIKSQKARDSEFTTNSEDHPLIVQFAANNANDFADAAELVAPYAQGVDLNCGCPQRWAMAEGYGAWLIKHPELVRDMVRTTKGRVDSDFTVSIKIRIHSDIRKTVELCQIAEHVGVSFLTVHGRTTTQRSEPADMEAIRTIKENVSVPVFANGDVRTLQDAQMVREMTGVDGVMSARGMLQNPAMFAGYSETPLCCVQDWVDLGLSLGTPFTCFHHHLIQMLEQGLPKAEKKVFNVLTSTAGILDYLEENYGISYNPDRIVNGVIDDSVTLNR